MIDDARRYSTRYDTPKGEKKLAIRQRNHNWEDAPSFVPMTRRKGWPEGGGISSTPLHRFLEGNVGKKWVDIKDKVPASQAENLRWMLLTDVQLEDGKYTSTKGLFYRRTSFFVDKEGILQGVKGERFKYGKKRVLEVISLHGGKLPPCFLYDNPNRREGLAELLVFEGKKFVRRLDNGFWYERRVVGSREVPSYVYDSNGGWSGKVVYYREDVSKDFQVDGRLQKRLNAHVLVLEQKGVRCG